MSLYNFSILHNLVAPVTILIASICTDSNLDFSSLLQLSHIGPPYSRTGLTKDMYIRSKDCLSNLNLKALIILRRCHALCNISSI